MTIFLDTNVVPYKSGISIRFETIQVLAQECSQEIAIPELVLRESVAHRQREIEDAFGTLRRAYEKARIYLNGIAEPNLPCSKDLAESWCCSLKEKVKILETPKNAFEEGIFREIQRIRPTREGRGARDAVIWLTIKQAHFLSDSVNYFVSENIKDFASSDKNTLHEDLKMEIIEHPIPLIYCNSLDILLKKIANEEKPGIDITEQLINSSDNLQEALRRAIRDNLIIREMFPALPLGKEYISSTITPSLYKVKSSATYRIGERNVVVAEINCNASFTIGVLQQLSGGGFLTLQYPADLSLYIRFWMRFENQEELPVKAEVSYINIANNTLLIY
ncbi:PIN domain-containing protein [Nostoc sp. DedQUE07]|uniref:PIN domain-containing protein n=1 Tax=Nostoc sp. DedQUE07 TaxID=3075392 RepID=UPI002AD30160|nr:PIN domain-containing protein [Nostoc sp. DedQUE07]MDZ8133188.1 PIN domain-containing protein [Nostoc sp. DedQUE07]